METKKNCERFIYNKDWPAFALNGCQIFTFALSQTIQMHLKAVVINTFMWTKRGGLATPVPMHMGGAESKAVVKKGGVDNGPALRPLQEVTQVAQVSVTTPHAVPGAVLIQDKHLAWAEPTLHTITQAQRREQCRRLPAEVPAGPGANSPGSRRCRWACGPTWAAAPSQKARRGQSYRG